MLLNNSPMFSVPLIHIKANNWKSKKIKLLSLIDEGLLHPADGGMDLVTNDYRPQYDNPDLMGMHNINVQNILEEEIREFMNASDFTSVEILMSWFETCNKTEWHGIHNHGPVGYSAVCFIQYNPEVHKPTQFVSPFSNFVTGSIIEHSPSDVDEGSLIFFPASIHHYTLPNVSDEVRIIMSFNLKINV